MIDKIYIKKTGLSTPTPQCAAVTERFIITNAVVVKSLNENYFEPTTTTNVY